MKKLLSNKLFLITLFIVSAVCRMDAQNGMYYDDKHNFLIPMTQDNSLKGYAYVYKDDRVSKDSNSFIMEAYDELLRDVGEKKIVMPVDYTFHSAVFNGTHFVLKFQQRKEAIRYLVFDQQAKQVFDTLLNIKVAEVDDKDEVNYSPAPIHVVNNQGMLDYVFVHGKEGVVPMIIFLSNDFKLWQYTFEKRKNKFNVQRIGADNNYIVNAIYEFVKNNETNTSVRTFIQVMSIGGGVISETPLDMNESVSIFPIKADIEKNTIKMISEFTKRKGFYDKVKYGICTHDISFSGDIFRKSFNEITSTMKDDSLMKKYKMMVNSYLYMSNAVRLDNGNWLVAGEQFQRTVNRVRFSKPSYTVYNKANICLLEVDNDAKVVSKHIEKNKLEGVRMMKYNHRYSPELGSMYITASNLLDFNYFLEDRTDGNERISFVYRDYDVANRQTYVGNIVYEHDTFSVDRVKIKKFSDNTAVFTFPARFGRLLLIRYDAYRGLVDFDNIKFNN